MADCPNLADNKAKCTCGATTCERHGKCCECIRFHLDKGGLPNCAKAMAGK